MAEEDDGAVTTYPFALVLVRDPTTKKFAVVEEKAGEGFGISGGKVERGEDFATAAVREAKEELGIDVKLTGIIRIEHSLVTKKLARMRLIFTGEPVDPAAPLKTVADKESIAGHWMTLEDILRLQAERKTKSECCPHMTLSSCGSCLCFAAALGEDRV